MEPIHDAGARDRVKDLLLKEIEALAMKTHSLLEREVVASEYESLCRAQAALLEALLGQGLI